MAEGGLPGFTPRGEDAVSCHATAISHAGRALILAGPSGSGKSGTAAQMIAHGAGLIADDLTILRRVAQGLQAEAPGNSPAAMELRGLGIVPVACAAPAPLAAITILAPVGSRMPEPEHVIVLGQSIPVLRHPAAPDLAAKLLLWLAAGEGAAI